MSKILNLFIVYILPFLILDYKLVLLIYLLVFLNVFNLLTVPFTKGVFGNIVKPTTLSVLYGIFSGLCYLGITYYFNFDIKFLLILFIVKTGNNMDASRNMIYPDEKLEWLGEIYTIAISTGILYLIRNLI